MTFAQIDDHFDDSPKFVDYDASVMGLLACGITYANRHLTNGVIPRGWPKRRFPRDGERALATLLKDGRWILREDGNLEIVGFLDHNLSRDEVLEKRAAKTEVKSEAGRVGGIRSGEARRSRREAESKQTPSSTEASACKHAKQNEALSSPLLSTPRSDPPLPPEDRFAAGTDPVSAIQLRVAPVADPLGDYDIGEAWAAGVHAGSGCAMTVPRGEVLRRLIEAVRTHGPAREGPFGSSTAARYAREAGELYGAAKRADKRTAFLFCDWLDSGNGKVDEDPPLVLEKFEKPVPLTPEQREAQKLAAEQLLSELDKLAG